MRARLRTLTREVLSALDKCLGLLEGLGDSSSKEFEEVQLQDAKERIKSWRQETLKLVVAILSDRLEDENSAGARYVRLTRRRYRRRRRFDAIPYEEVSSNENGRDC